MERPVTRLLFLDLETVTLEPQPGSIWEIGWAGEEGPVQSRFVIPDLTIAHPIALNVGRFGQRYDHGAALSQREACGLVEDLVSSDECVILGSAPWFDADHLEAMMGGPGRWHHHHDDLPVRAAGLLGLAPPVRLKDAAAAAGFDLDAYELHTAAGDVALTRDLYRWWRRQFVASVEVVTGEEAVDGCEERSGNGHTWTYPAQGADRG